MLFEIWFYDASQFDQLFIVCESGFACNTAVCLQLYDEILLDDVRCIPQKANDDLNEASRGISDVELFQARVDHI